MGGVVLVTGASTGIGRAVAEQLAARGYEVLAGVRKPEDAERYAAASDNPTPVFLDVTKAESVEAAFVQVAEACGERGLAAVINNAGVAVGGPIEGVALDDLRWQLEVNVIGLVAVTQAAVPLLRVCQGRIVNIGSMAGRITAPLLGPYSASKHAVVAISAALRQELAPWGIHTVLIEPGAIVTPIWSKAEDVLTSIEAGYSVELQDYYRDAIGRLARVIRSQDKKGVPPERVAEVVILAIESRVPRTRYAVGRDAKVGMAIRALLSDRWMDWFIGRTR